MSIRQPLNLSPREQQLINFAAEGLTDTAIAHRLGISEATVGTYWGRVRIKIGPYNRTELVSIFLRANQELALDALRRENAELLEKLRASSSEGTQAETTSSDLIENAPDAIVIVTETGVVSSANRAAHDLFGYEPGEMAGRPVADLIPVRFREVHGEHREEYLRSPERRTMGQHLQTPALRKDGVEFMVRAALSAMKTPAGYLVTCVLRQAEEP